MALGGIYDTGGISWQVGTYFLIIKFTPAEFFKKFLLELFVQLYMCECFAYIHICASVACLTSMEAGGGSLEEWPCFTRMRELQLLVIQGPLKRDWG